LELEISIAPDRQMIAQRFGRLTVVDLISAAPPVCECVCDCGASKHVSAYCLRSGSVRSCGCLKGVHPNSLANLDGAKRSKHKQRRNFTLLPETIAWLEKQPNASAAIDRLVALEKRQNERDRC